MDKGKSVKVSVLAKEGEEIDHNKLLAKVRIWPLQLKSNYGNIEKETWENRIHIKRSHQKKANLGVSADYFNTSFTANLFKTNVEDLITSDQTFTSLANIEKAEIHGIEVTARGMLSKWVLDLNLTLLDHENSTSGEELLRRPKTSFSMQSSRQYDKWDIAINWLIQSDHKDLDPVSFGPSEIGGYGIFNVIAGYNISETMALRFRIGNLLNKKYEVVDGFNTLPLRCTS